MKKNLLKRHIGYWINRLRNVIHYAFEERLAKHDVSVAEWCILLSVYDGSADSVNDIAAYIEIDKASVSRIVERLSKRGVLVHQAGKDKRSGVITLTEKGKVLVPKLLQEAEDNEIYFFNKLSREEKEHMRNIMYTILRDVPGIELDGWINNNNSEITMETIKNIFEQATINQWPYPKTFQALKDAGLEYYTVHFADYYKAKFSGTFGEFTKDSFEGYNPLKASSVFNAEGIKNAVIKHVKERTHYLDFLQDAANNGATHYDVDMKQRSVTYFNADQSASYIEYVPEFTGQ